MNFCARTIALASSQTYELSISPGSHRAAIINILLEFGIEDFVESATDSINADDVDWDQVLAEWTERDDSPLLVYRGTEEELIALVQRLQTEFAGAVTTSGKWITDDLWKEAWETDFQHLETEKFFISSRATPAPSGKQSIVLAEGAVFGSGQHATTQALVRLMESHAAPRNHASFLDVGMGTGVLAFVAHYLGYTHLVGTEIEEEAIATADANARRNHIKLGLHLGAMPPKDRKWDTVACNILPPTLTDLLVTLKELLAPQGRLYLAGFNDANSESVRAELTRLDLKIVDEKRERGWLGWLVMRTHEL